MVNYSFTTDQGWRVTEYRPFSASYAVLHTPCIRDYQHMRAEQPHAGDAATSGGVYTSVGADDLLGTLTGRQLTFESFSADVLRQLLEERVAIRDRNRSSILGRITDVSGDIYGASLLHTPDSDKRKQGLEKVRLDLERDLRETDERLWKDTAEIREKLVAAARRFDGTYLRSSLFSPVQFHNDNHQGQGFSGLSDKV
jgi:hypothetical protein